MYGSCFVRRESARGEPEDAEMPEPNYKQLSNKQRKQHYVSVLVERLSGKDHKAIAESLQMTEESDRCEFLS